MSAQNKFERVEKVGTDEPDVTAPQDPRKRRLPPLPFMIRDSSDKAQDDDPPAALYRMVCRTRPLTTRIIMELVRSHGLYVHDFIAAYFWIIIMRARVSRKVEKPIPLNCMSRLYISTTATLDEATGSVKFVTNETDISLSVSKVPDLAAICPESPQGFPGTVNQAGLVKLAEHILRVRRFNSRESFNIADGFKDGFARSVFRAEDPTLVHRHPRELLFESLLDESQQGASPGATVPGVDSGARPLMLPCEDDYGLEGTVVLLAMDGQYGRDVDSFRVLLCLSPEDMKKVEKHLAGAGEWDMASVTSL